MLNIDCNVSVAVRWVALHSSATAHRREAVSSCVWMHRWIYFSWHSSHRYLSTKTTGM